MLLKLLGVGEHIAMLLRTFMALCLLWASVSAHAQEAQPAPPQQQREPSRTKETLTDAAIALIIIATSIAYYKASGRPCACPEDTMRNGRRCGSSSAWSRPGGAKPLCYVSDITASMIEAFRKNKAVPPLN